AWSKNSSTLGNHFGGGLLSHLRMVHVVVLQSQPSDDRGAGLVGPGIDVYFAPGLPGRMAATRLSFRQLLAVGQVPGAANSSGDGRNRIAGLGHRRRRNPGKSI